MQRILRLPEVIKRTGLPRSTIYAAMQSGRFPLQFPLGERSVGWDESAINDWVKARISKSSEVTK